MIRFFEYFASRHMLANILMVVALGGGLLVATSVRRDLFPRVELDQVVVTTLVPGASPEDVELNVTTPIETELNALSDLKKTESISIEDYSVIVVHLDPDLSRSRIDALVQSIRESAARARLPSDLPGPPRVSRIRMSELPILEVGVVGKGKSYRELREEARILSKELKEIDGVAAIKKYGYRPREVKVEIDPGALARHEVALSEVVRALSERNVRSTGGQLESFTGRRNLVTLARFRDPSEAEDVVIRSNFLGNAVRVGDVAAVRDGFKEERTLSRINGQPDMIVLSIRKREAADIIRTTERIRRHLEQRDVPGLEYHFSNQLARYVSTSFDVVVTNGLTGLVLVCLVLVMFLNFRTALWVALGIPVSLLGAIALLPLFDVYLDVVTLTAMILLLGLIVDDAIIVAESIHAHYAEGMSPVAAAGAALGKMIVPVVTTIATTILAFMPMFFIPGEIGKFIFVIPLVIALALLVSLLEGVLILPAHVAGSLGKQTESAGVDWRQAVFERWRAKYTDLLGRLLDRRHALIGVFALALVGSLTYASLRMNIVLFPTDSAEEFAIFLETPVGTALEETSRRMGVVEDFIHDLPEAEVLSFVTIVGNQEGFLTENNIGVIRVNLAPFSSRDRKADEIAATLRAKTDALIADGRFTKITYDVKGSGPNPGKPLELRLVGGTDHGRRAAADDLVRYLKQQPGVRDAAHGDRDGKPEIEVRLDYDRLARMGLSVSSVAATIRAAFDGEVATRMQYGEDRVDFRVVLPAEQRRDLGYLRNMETENRAGQRIRLEHLARFEERRGPARFVHYNGERTVLVSGDIDRNLTSLKNVINGVRTDFEPTLPPGLRLRIEGEGRQQQESTGHALRAFLAAVICIYLLLALLFQSFTRPFLIVAAVPFGLIGVIIAFGLHGLPLSFMAMLGVVGLTGVVVNDSLVLISQAGDLRRAHPDWSPERVIIAAAGSRLRPIIMTTLTTAAGLLPLAYGLGGEDPTNAPMALALGWGLVFATGLILVLLPCMFMAGVDLGRRLAPTGLLVLRTVRYAKTRWKESTTGPTEALRVALLAFTSGKTRSI